jgi:hypothetical protein
MLRRTALAGMAVAALGLTAACGSSADSAASAPTNAATSASPGAATSASAGAATSAATSAATGAPVPGGSVDAASVQRLFGDAMSAADTAHVDMKMSGQVEISASGDMDMKSNPLRADLRLDSSTLGGSGSRLLMVDNAMYLHVPALGKKYAKISLAGKDSPLAQLGLSSLDPSAMLEQFGKAVSGGTYVGTETIDGTATDHYRLSLDPKAIASALPSLSADSGATPGTETVDVWFDGEGRYKRMKMDAAGETVTETFADWGKPVTVKAPPANQVQDMTSMLGGALSGATGS